MCIYIYTYIHILYICTYIFTWTHTYMDIYTCPEKRIAAQQNGEFAVLVHGLSLRNIALWHASKQYSKCSESASAGIVSSALRMRAASKSEFVRLNRLIYRVREVKMTNIEFVISNSQI